MAASSRTSHRAIGVVLLIFIASLLLGGGGTAVAQTAPASLPAQTQPAPLTLDDQRVLNAVNRGVDFLLADTQRLLTKAASGLRQGGEGTENSANAVSQALGEDAGDLMLQAYALFYVGQELRDPRLSLRDQRMAALKEVVTGWSAPDNVQNETYTTALQALALSQLPKLPEVDAAMKRAGLRLVNGMNARGGYSYYLSRADDPDGSNSQYGLLGAWAAADWGVPIPPNYWNVSSAFWRRTQEVNGGWAYRTPGNAISTMTAAGVASLYVCNEFADKSARPDGTFDPAIERGLANLTASFDPRVTDLYYLYGLERVSLAGGFKYLGKHNWYLESVINLLETQLPDGSFHVTFNGATPQRATAYAILYLVRGRAPVLMNKLQYDGNWNIRPRDSANLHAILSRTFERRLNWQVVPLSSDPNDWLDAPILLITGNKDPQFSDEEIDKLRTFVEHGGMIFSVNVGSNLQFKNAMANYAARVASPAGVRAAPDLPSSFRRDVLAFWRELPPVHPLNRVMELQESLPPLMAMSNGVREVWVHCDTDLTASWQSKSERNKSAFDLPARLFIYNAGRDALKSRRYSTSIPDPPTPPRTTIKVARVRFRGNWNPEPGAWPRLSRLLSRDADTALDLSELTPEALMESPRASRPPLAILSGTGHLTLTEPTMKALREYVYGGGTLLVEAAGGERTFAKDGHDLLLRLFPESRLTPIPPEYLLYAGTFSPHAVKLGAVEFTRAWTDANGPQTKLRMNYMTLNGRLGVLFSEDDLTHGLLGFDTAGVLGYQPAFAQEIARNIVLFSAINQRQ